jgi:hypothetical protein
MKDGKDMRPVSASSGEEREIDRVLGLASSPRLPEGAAARLMARIVEEPQGARVIALAPRRSPLRYAAALPLAASLALGVYLGAQGSLDFMFPTAITGAQAEEVMDELGGVGEAEDYAEENFS